MRESVTWNKHTRERLLAHCGDFHEDDGVDPREYFRKPTRGGHGRRKTLQLCSQVAETLVLVLAGELEDDLLQELRVASVDPAPDASQLAVTLCAPHGYDSAPMQTIRERLDRVAGRLRCEVAAAITRKRAPRLVFHLISAPDVSETP